MGLGLGLGLSLGFCLGLGMSLGLGLGLGLGLRFTYRNKVMKNKYKQAFMKTAYAFAECSHAVRLKVGAVL
jgi:hypothetical protein